MVGILFFVSAFVAEVIGTTAGFGSSTVFLPLALLFFDFRSALVLVAFLHIAGNIGRIGFFRHGLDKNLIIKFGLPSVALTLIGALLVSQLNQEVLKGILGIFLVIYAGYSLWKEDLKFNATATNAIIGGSLSGFLAGLIGTGGALRSAFLTAFGLSKEKYLATSSAIALAVDLTRLPVYLSQGFLSKSYFPYIFLLLIVAFLGSYLGKLIVSRIAQPLFKKIALLALLLIGSNLSLNLLSASPM